MNQLIDPKSEWANEIGRIVIAFGEIEHVTMVCLRQLPLDPIYLATKKMLLRPRLDLLIAVLSKRSDQNAVSLKKLFEEARELAEDRNLILHNPLTVEVSEKNDGGYVFQHEIISVRNANKRLSLLELADIRERVERLARKLYEVAAPLLEKRTNTEKLTSGH